MSNAVDKIDLNLRPGKDWVSIISFNMITFRANNSAHGKCPQMSLLWQFMNVKWINTNYEGI